MNSQTFVAKAGAGPQSLLATPRSAVAVDVSIAAAFGLFAARLGAAIVAMLVFIKPDGSRQNPNPRPSP